MIMARGMRDLLHDGPRSSDVELVSFCSLDNLQDFKFDPPRTRQKTTQAALVLISWSLRDMTMGTLSLAWLALYACCEKRRSPR